VTQVLAIPIGPDGVGGSFQNDVGTRRASDWFELGARGGVLKGLTWAQVPGLMALDLAAGAALVPVRDASAVVQDEGYLLRTPPGSATVRVNFQPASAAARNDALVAAVSDISIGSAGTAALAAGGHLYVVQGVSGTSTPRTDAQVNAVVGGGGWIRLADVPIAATDTQINTANITNQAWQLRGWNTLPFTAATGFSWTTAQYRISSNGMVSFNLIGTYSGAGLTSDATGNIAGDPNMMTGLPAAILPPSSQFRGINVDKLGLQMFRGFVDGSANALRLASAITPSISIPNGTGLQVTDSYYP
jgi:hypothetical protein